MAVFGANLMLANAGDAAALLFTRLTLLMAVTFAWGCDRAKDPNVELVKLSGQTFRLELALDSQARFKGLSDRAVIDADAGMLFVFPDRDVQVMQFVMRDCPIPIDIIFLDKTGRITAMHKMLAEPPRSADEKTLGPNGLNLKYENRLRRYSSRYNAQFVIELAGGTLDRLSLKEGDKIELDIEGLKKRAS